MSGRIVGEVLRYAPEDLTPLELLVLIALAESALHGTRRASFNTSCQQIADRTRAKPSSVKSALYALRQRGLIVGVHAKPRKGLAQEYDLTDLTADTRRAVWSSNGTSP